MFGDDAAWHFWTPEIIRHIAGSPWCAAPKLSQERTELGTSINTWGPLLPLLHFHLGWERIDVGLARWAASGFDPFDDATLKVIVKQWGPGLPAATRWSVAHAMDRGLPDVPDLPVMQSDWRGTGPEGLHLGWAHWNSPERFAPSGAERVADVFYQQEANASGELALAVPSYAGWYRVLKTVGDGLVTLPSGRSWRVNLTIAPIGFVGTFRKSRVSGRWFTGRHKAHALGLAP